MPYSKDRSDSPRRRPMHRRKKVCVFCGKENNEIDYKDVAIRGRVILIQKEPFQPGRFLFYEVDRSSSRGEHEMMTEPSNRAGQRESVLPD